MTSELIGIGDSLQDPLFDRNNRPVSIGYWLDRRDGTRRIIMPMQNGNACIMTLSNEHRIKAFNLWDWQNGYGVNARKIKQVASFGNKLYIAVERGDKWELHEYDESLSKIAEGSEDGDEQVLSKELAPYIPKTFANRTRHRRVYKINIYVEDAKQGDVVVIYKQNPKQQNPKRKPIPLRKFGKGFATDDFTGFIKKNISLNLASLKYRSGVGGFIIQTRGKMVFSQVEYDTAES